MEALKYIQDINVCHQKQTSLWFISLHVLRMMLCFFFSKKTEELARDCPASRLALKLNQCVQPVPPIPYRGLLRLLKLLK